MPQARKPRVVIAGQVPPPYGGQNVMIARILAELRQTPGYETAHLAFGFSPTFKTVRQGNVKKLWELVKVLARLLRVRLGGPIDVLIYPVGGPQTVPIIRDILLLPWILLAARRVVLHFHAAGVADRFATRRGLLGSLLAWLYRRADTALVMTEFNQRDPAAFGVGRIFVRPHKLPDTFDASALKKSRAMPRILALGHICPDKGTPALLRAFAGIAQRNKSVRLELVGECLPPMNDESLHGLLRELGIEDRVDLPGVLTGRDKQEAFGRATVFAFPSVAPYESFGLVMVEAMMWSLPIVATDWRGNRDVLGDSFEGICFQIGEDLAVSLESALEIALTKALAAPSWGEMNRRIYENNYRADAESADYATLLPSLLEMVR